MTRRVVLVKHAQPALDPSVAAREWRLSDEGEAGARRLAAWLRRFVPLQLVSSREAKARRTSEIVGEALGVTFRIVDDLKELDRPVLPIVAAEEHERFNAAVFRDVDRRVIGTESAAEALARFGKAIGREMACDGDAHLVVISHGTVISLLAAAHNHLDAFDLWKRLRCPAVVVLSIPSLELVEVVDHVG